MKIVVSQIISDLMGGVEKFEYRSTNFYVSRLFRFQTTSFSEYAVVFDTRAIVCFSG